jgi:cytochrome c-type biogenesis protein CcmH
MILAFVLIAGTLATGAAILLLPPLLRRREDARPAASMAAVAVLIVTLLGGAGLYATFSNYGWLDTPPVADTPAAMTARLADRLAHEPGKLEDWLLLGRSYAVIEQYPLAIRAYQRADRIANGASVDAILGVAESMLAMDSSELNGAAGKLFERALQLEPGNPKALFYGAFAALARGELPVAKQRFQGMLALNPPPEIRATIEKRIADIDAAYNGTGPSAPAADAAAPAADATAQVAVHVTLAPALAAKVPADAALFVAARDPKSPGPPFAVKRLPAKFPVDVVLTAADAMMASRSIRGGQQLEVVARVALGGTPTATAGDPFGQVSYHVGADGKLNIVIDRLAP